MHRRGLASGIWIALLCSILAVPTFAQTSWTTYPGNPVIPYTVGGQYVLSPSVIFDGAMYRMWFTAHPAGGPWYIDYASSPDGTHWFPYANNPVLVGGLKPFESTGAIYAGVVYDGSQYRMYYTGLSGCCGAGVGLATSSDGITWTKYPDNPILTPSSSGWDSGTIGASNGVYFDGTTYYLMYQGVGPSSEASVSLESSIATTTVVTGTLQQIGIATSTDGVHFTKNPSNPVIAVGGLGAWDAGGLFPGGMFAHNGLIYAVYSAVPANFSKESLGMVASLDGSHWVKDARSPIFSGTALWDWNIGSGSPVLRNGTMQLWYSGNAQGGGTWSIGYASAPFDQPTAVRASLVSAETNATGVHIVWSTTSAARVTVFRRTENEAWTALASLSVTDDLVRLDDAQVEPGRRYAYAIGSEAEASDLLAGETWIDVPARTVLQLRGAQPNPSPGTVTASFTLPSRGRVSLDLFDLAGRQVIARRDVELDAGVHLVPMIAEGRTPAGVYMLRMGFDGRTLEARVIVIQ